MNKLGMITFTALTATGLTFVGTAAHADEPATYSEQLAPALDCGAGTWAFTTVTYTATIEGEVDGEPVYSEWVELERSAEIGYATGTELGDCPNLTLDDDGWHANPVVPALVEPAEAPKFPGVGPLLPESITNLADLFLR